VLGIGEIGLNKNSKNELIILEKHIQLAADHNQLILENYGDETIWMNSACDWGVSDPLAVPKTAQVMRQRGHDPARIHKVVFENPVTFMSQCPKFKVGADA